jgi:hypothetical protein
MGACPRLTRSCADGLAGELADAGVAASEGTELARWDMDVQGLTASLLELEKGMLPDEDLEGQDDEQEDWLDEDNYLRDDRRWKRNDRIAIPEKGKRSLDSEGNLVMALQKLQREAGLSEMNARMAEDKAADRKTRVKQMFYQIE